MFWPRGLLIRAMSCGGVGVLCKGTEAEEGGEEEGAAGVLLWCCDLKSTFKN